MRFFFVVLLFHVLPDLKGQNVLKFRSGLVGLDVPFSNGTWGNYQHVLSNQYYQLYKLPRPVPFIELHGFAEFERNKKWSLALGYSDAGGGAGFNMFYLQNDDYPETPEVDMGYAGISDYTAITLHKVPAYFSYAVLKSNRNRPTEIGESGRNKVYLQLDMLGGFSLVFLNRNLPRYFEIQSPFISEVFTAENDKIVTRTSYSVINHTGFNFLFGTSVRFRSAKHEIACLMLSYEQGMVPLLSFSHVGVVNDQYKYTNLLGSYGSCLTARLTFPIFTYNFTQKKFYRD
jgi:hypothetical protein